MGHDEVVRTLELQNLTKGLRFGPETHLRRPTPRNLVPTREPVDCQHLASIHLKGRSRTSNEMPCKVETMCIMKGLKTLRKIGDTLTVSELLTTFRSLHKKLAERRVTSRLQGAQNQGLLEIDINNSDIYIFIL